LFELLSVDESLLAAASFVGTGLIYLFDVNGLLLFRTEFNCRGSVVTVIIFVIRIINVRAQLILTGLRWHYSVSLKRNGDCGLSSDDFHEVREGYRTLDVIGFWSKKFSELVLGILVDLRTRSGLRCTRF
jgi:hypothetical protein